MYCSGFSFGVNRYNKSSGTYNTCFVIGINVMCVTEKKDTAFDLNIFDRKLPTLKTTLLETEQQHNNWSPMKSERKRPERMALHLQFGYEYELFSKNT